MKVYEITRRLPLFEGDQTVLTQVIAPPSESPMIGDEKVEMVTPEIFLLTSPHGSYRFIYRQDGSIVSGLQIVSRDGKSGQIANVYTLPEYQRRGLARELLRVARTMFKKVDQAPEEHRTELGKKFAAGTG